MARIVRSQFGTRRHRPNPRWQRGDPPRSARRIDWPLIRLVALVFTASFVWLLPALHGRGGSLKDLFDDVLDVSVPAPWSSGIHVVDGDTVRSGGRTYRLVGFNTPEQGTLAQCGRERALASKAKDRLRELMGAREVALSRVSCACKPGTENTDACNYGRLCGRLKADGRDVGQILIAEGLAETYTCSATACPPRKNWCRG